MKVETLEKYIKVTADEGFYISDYKEGDDILSYSSSVISKYLSLLSNNIIPENLTFYKQKRDQAMPIHYLISKNLYGGDAIGRVVLLQLRQQLPPKLPFRNSHLSIYPMGSLSLLHCRRGLLEIPRLTSHKKERAVAIVLPTLYFVQ